MILTAVGLLAAALAATNANADDGVSGALDQALARVTEGATDDALLALDALTRQLARDGGRQHDLAFAYLLTAAAHAERGAPARAGAYLREAARLDRQIMRHLSRLPEKARAFCAALRGELPGVPEPEPTAVASASSPAATPATSGTAAYRPPPRRGSGGGGAAALGVLGVLTAGGAGSALGYLGAAKGEPGTTVSALPGPQEDRRRDDDADGFSENQGDCDDNNPRVRPDGRVIVGAPYSPIAGMTVNCRELDYSTIMLTNNSCRAVDVQSIRQVSGVVRGHCHGGSGSLSISQRQVPPGETRAIANAVLSSSQQGVGCCSASCSGTVCEFVRNVTVTTNAGTFTVSGYRFGIEFRNCARCLSFGLPVGLAPLAADCPGDPR